MEEWRAIVGFEGSYEVSNLGRVRSLDRMINMAHGAKRSHRGRVLQPVYDKDGYPRVMLRVDGAYAKRGVHRLVCEAFHGPGTILHREVDHIDRDTSNARAENLRWVSRGENHSHRRLRNPNAALTRDAVIEIKATPKRRGLATALARKFDVPPAAIYDVLRGGTWRTVNPSGPNTRRSNVTRD